VPSQYLPNPPDRKPRPGQVNSLRPRRTRRRDRQGKALLRRLRSDRGDSYNDSRDVSCSLFEDLETWDIGCRVLLTQIGVEATAYPDALDGLYEKVEISGIVTHMVELLAEVRGCLWPAAKFTHAKTEDSTPSGCGPTVRKTRTPARRTMDSA
jgi:hypothetical protein